MFNWLKRQWYIVNKFISELTTTNLLSNTIELINLMQSIIKSAGECK